MKSTKLKYPEFSSDILLSCKDDMFKFYAEKFLIEKLSPSNLNIKVKVTDEAEIYTKGEWIANSPIYSFYISDKFLNNHYIPTSNDFILFQETFKAFINPFTKISPKPYKEINSDKTRPFASIVCLYRSKTNLIFKFLFEIAGNENNYEKALIDVYKTIKTYSQRGKNPLKEAISNSFTQSNKIKYFLYSENSWNVVNPLLEIVAEINNSYRKNKDFRIKKPQVLLHQNDFRKYFVFDNNWVLTFDNLETLMIKPNDVSLYSNISDTNLKKAKQFYEETIRPRHKHYYGTFPSIKTQGQYFDYFELIISALILAYTSIEAFANICIPNNFEYLIEKDNIKTIYSKEAIERKFSLRDKFKIILKSILNTPDPTTEKWWSNFIELENLRNEIIHTKQSKSEARYSQLLSNKIFHTIQIHKEIIKFYGFHISNNKKELLKEFPYNFGFDDFFPGLMTAKGYEESNRVLHNTSIKKPVKRSIKK